MATADVHNDSSTPHQQPAGDGSEPQQSYLKQQEKRYQDMLLEDPGDSLWAQLWLTIALAGFLIIPGAFPKIEKILSGSDGPTDTREVANQVPLLWVVFFPIVPLFENGRSCSFSNIYLANLVGFKQQTSIWLQLLRHWGDRSALSCLLPLEKIPMAFLHHLCPRDAQWHLWLNLDVSEHLWL